MFARVHRLAVRPSVRVAAVVAGALLFVGVGCSSPNEYKPNASATNLAAFAAQQKYPVSMQGQDDLHLTSIVDKGNNQLVLRNFNGMGLTNFNVWINGTYVLHVDNLDTNSSRIISLGDFYNSAGNNDLSPDKVTKVQVQTSDGRLLNVQGPQQQ